MRCYIIDDQEHSIINLSRRIQKTPGLELVGTATDPFQGLNEILSGKVKADILFADIDMPGLSGLELPRQLGQRIILIFVTGHPQYAIQAIDMGATGYLRKPVNPGEFARAIDRARELFNLRADRPSLSLDSILLKEDNYHFHLVSFDKLIWIQANNKYVILYQKDEMPLNINDTLSAMEAKLPPFFIRIQKSAIINLRLMLKIVYNKVVMYDGEAIEIGPAYKDEFYRQLDML